MARDLTVWLATMHPFTKDGDLDEPAFRAHLRRIVAAGVGVNCANEASGEGFSLSPAEVRRILRVVKEECKGKVYTRGMGRMARTAAEQVDFVKEVAAAGLDGVHIYQLDLGHGSIPTEMEQETYLTDILSECKLPTMISIHNAARYRYPVPLVKRLADRFDSLAELIVLSEGVGATDDGYLNAIYAAIGPDRLKVFVPTHQVLHSLAMGGAGFAAPEANLIPRTCAAFISHYRAGRYAEALATYKRIAEINHRLRPYAGIGARKAALTLLGCPMGEPRKPRLPFPKDRLPELARVLDELNIRELEGFGPPR